MKRCISIFTLILLGYKAMAQPNWIKRAGGQATDLCNGLWVDHEKNVFLAGSISDKAKFYKTEVESRGGGDVYVAKYNKDGVLIWVKTFGGKLDDFANAITGDPEGNLYITGVFTDSAQFEDETLESNGPDLFVAKLDPKGHLVWAKKMETLGTALVQCIAVTEQGGVFIGGLFSNQYNASEKLQYGQTDGFITKLSWQGEVSWTRIVGGPGFDEVNVLKTDPWGRVVASGNFDQFLFVEDKAFEGQSSKSAFALRMESTGTILWSKTFSGKDAQVHISDATTDLEGQVFICGKFSGESKFDLKTVNSKGQTDIFVACIAKSGDIKWVSEVGGSDVEEAFSISLSENQKSVLVSGSFNKLVENGRKSLSADYDNQVLVSRWDLRGNLDELRKLEFNSVFQCAGKNLDGLGNLWLSGSFNKKTNFGKTNFVSAGEEDIFISALSEPKIAK
jgi:hypothetical protein